MNRRALLFWPLALGFVAAGTAWLFYVPRQMDRLPRAIPASADFLSAHHDLNGRWDSLVGHPLLAGLAESLGLEREALEKMKTDPGFRRLLGVVASDDLLVAHVPMLRSTGEPAWVFASWLGGHSQRARWLLKSITHPDLQRAAARNGWLVWVWTPRELKGQRVTFALVEGMLVGCVARETMGIDDLLAGVDGHAVTLSDRPWLTLTERTGALDRGWFRNARGAFFPFQVALTNGRVKARVETPWAVPAMDAASTNRAASLTGLSGLAGDRAVAVAAVDRTWVQHWLRHGTTNVVGHELAGLISQTGEGPVGLALLGGDFSGRFMAVRLPTLLAGVAGSSAAQTRFLLDALDRLNALTRWGLVAAPLLVESAPAFAIESTGQSLYARMNREELLAYTPTSDGLVFASNLAVLERLLRTRTAGGTSNALPLTAGLNRLHEGAARASLWFNASEGAKVVRLGVTAWSLKLLLEDAQGTQATRQRMNEFKAWMDALAPLGQVRMDVTEKDQRAVFNLEAGVP